MTGDRGQGTGDRGQVTKTNYQLQITNYQLPITNYPLPITNYQLPITHYPLPITNYPLPITNYQLPSNLKTLDSRGQGYGAWVDEVSAKPLIQFVSLFLVIGQGPGQFLIKSKNDHRISQSA